MFNSSKRILVPALLASALVATWRAHSFQVARCPERTPDPETAQFCDGGIQSTCENIAQPGECNGKKRDREVIMTSCMQAACSKCLTLETLCWTEYQCVWNQDTNKCENGSQTDSGTVMAKFAAGCEGWPGCEQ
jgi:hypothetical protein